MVELSTVILLLVLLGSGAPVALALCLSGVFGLYMLGGTGLLFGILTTVPRTVAMSYELITVPMFLLMANFIIISGIADSLFRAIAVWFGRVPGGLGIATALAGAGFGALSGSSAASAATLSSTSVPAMLEQGYEPKLATGVVAISGTLAMLIPPSVALVIFGHVAEVSVGKLLIAGVIPGLLVTLVIAATVYFLVWMDPSRAPLGRRHSLHEKLSSLKVAGPVIFLFMAVTGVIYIGIATPTEAACLGALGALILAATSGLMTRASFVDALAKATRTTCMVMLIILGALIFGYFITITRIPQQIITFVGALDWPPMLTMVAILVFYLLLGCFLDQLTIIILTVPVVLPLVVAIGYDPVWFGVMKIVTAEVGMVTPPLGINVFVVASYTKRRPEEIFAGVAPHVIAHILLIAVFLLFPQIILWLPNRMG